MTGCQLVETWQFQEKEVEVENMEGVRGRLYDVVEAEAGGCAGSCCLEKWHFGELSNPCRRRNTDIKLMMMSSHSTQKMVIYLPSLLNFYSLNTLHHI